MSMRFVTKGVQLSILLVLTALLDRGADPTVLADRHVTLLMSRAIFGNGETNSGVPAARPARPRHRQRAM